LDEDERGQRNGVDGPLPRRRDGRGVEYRETDLAPFARATSGDGDRFEFSGYPSTFWHVDSYGTFFVPGCWTKTLQERGPAAPRPKVKVLWQHDPYHPIGHPTVLEQDGTGLRAEAHTLLTTRYGLEAAALVENGTLDGLSVGFREVRGRPATEDDPLILDFAPAWIKSDPTLAWGFEEVALWEFSLVTFESNEAALIEDGRAARHLAALRELLPLVRDGRLPERHKDALSQLVAAWQAGPGSAPPTAATARPAASAAGRTRRIDADAVLARYGMLGGGR